jgi:tRNA threonylcarbamoyladenosine biosynthesis protein TsaB
VLVLAIESSTDAAGVALADDAGTIAQSTLGRGRRHAETIAPAIKSCCEASGINLREVDAIVIDIGPGLFTGLRVGVGTAKALAYALDRPVVAVTSLQVLALAASASAAATAFAPPTASLPASATGPTRQSNVRVVPVLDARRGEVVSAEYGFDTEGLKMTGEETLETPADLAARLTDRSDQDNDPLLLVGDGALRYCELLTTVANITVAGPWLAAPPVAMVAELGISLASSGEFQDPFKLSPRYVRQADARINWTSRAPRHATSPDSGTI